MKAALCIACGAAWSVLAREAGLDPFPPQGSAAEIAAFWIGAIGLMAHTVR